MSKLTPIHDENEDAYTAMPGEDVDESLWSEFMNSNLLDSELTGFFDLGENPLYFQKDVSSDHDLKKKKSDEPKRPYITRTIYRNGKAVRFRFKIDSESGDTSESLQKLIGLFKKTCANIGFSSGKMEEGILMNRVRLSQQQQKFIVRLHKRGQNVKITQQKQNNSS